MKPKDKKNASKDESTASSRPNILMIMVDEYRYPRYDKDHGMKRQIKNIVGFKQGQTGRYARYFPGLMRLRENSVVLSDHTIASSACIPSRAALFTGQYGTRTGVTQTDGVFKSGEDNRFTWLAKDGAPTMGDWMKSAGYETYYFGKCHFANPPEHTLEEFGFDAWENSFPEPHGTLRNNLGFYRDYGFADLVTTFLKRKGLALDYDRQVAEGHEDAEPNPWFAVASFTNPHDITTWPVLAGQVDPTYELPDLEDLTNLEEGPDKKDLGTPLMVPQQGAKGNPPENGTWTIPLNPGGIPQDTADLPPNFSEDLIGNNKPSCHYEYSLKLGIALACKTGNPLVAGLAPQLTGMPFKLAKEPEEWGKAYLQYYTYLHHVVDQHIDNVMKTLDETGLSENTIVIFVPDHGEYGGAHGGMLQKWHTAYQETLQVPVVFSLPSNWVNEEMDELKQVDQLTSHIDLLPTLLGLAGVDSDERMAIATELSDSGHQVDPLVGADLSDLILGGTDSIQEPHGGNREGVLFATDDMITEFLYDHKLDELEVEQEHPLAEYIHDYKLYLDTVPRYKQLYPEKIDSENLSDGPIGQPCHVVCYREGEWKLVRYSSSEGHQSSGDQFEWELYNLDWDPNEYHNLLVAKSSSFTAFGGIDYPDQSMEEDEIIAKAEYLYSKMLAQIELKLMPTRTPY